MLVLVEKGLPRLLVRQDLPYQVPELGIMIAMPEVAHLGDQRIFVDLVPGALESPQSSKNRILDNDCDAPGAHRLISTGEVVVMYLGKFGLQAVQVVFAVSLLRLRHHR